MYWLKLVAYFILERSKLSHKALTCFQIDCTENRATCNELEVKGYPTLLWLKDGKKVQSILPIYFIFHFLFYLTMNENIKKKIFTAFVQIEKYQGSRTHEDLKAFVSKMRDAIDDSMKEGLEGEEQIV